MAKSYKLEDGNYIDSKGIVHSRKKLNTVLDSKIGYTVLENGFNINNIKENGRYGIFNASGTLPSGYSTSDNNVIIDCIMWSSLYGRQILHDVRTERTYVRNINNGTWRSWTQYTTQ